MQTKIFVSIMKPCCIRQCGHMSSLVLQALSMTMRHDIAHSLGVTIGNQLSFFSHVANLTHLSEEFIYG